MGTNFNLFLLQEALSTPHYLCRKKYRIENIGDFTTPKFNINLFKNKINLIEEVDFPPYQEVWIKMKLNKIYINTYTGGLCEEDDSDDSKGSIGDYLYIMIKDNNLVTLFFGYQKYKDCLLISSLIKITNDIGFNLSKINFNLKYDEIIRNYKYKKYSSDTVIKTKNYNLFYHSNFENIPDVFFDTTTLEPIDIFLLSEKDCNDILNELMFIKNKKIKYNDFYKQ